MLSTLIERTEQHVHEQFPEIVYIKPTFEELPDNTILGTYSYSLPGKVRWIFREDAMIRPGVLPGDVARMWVRENFKLPIRRRKDQGRKYVLPLRAVAGRYGEGAYVDVQKAYRRVLELVGYDVDYRIGAYLSCKSRGLDEAFYQHKTVYQQTIAIAASYTTALPVKRSGELKTRYVRNIFHNPCLYAFASEVLACWVGDVVEQLRCAYCNTDGVIVDARDADHAIELSHQYGLNASIASQGDTEVWGVGAYRCGARKTKRFDANARALYQSRLPDADERGWMKERACWAACNVG